MPITAAWAVSEVIFAVGQDKAMVPLGRHLVVCTSGLGVQRGLVVVQRWHHG